MKEDEPNSSICFHAPSKITVRTSLTLNNLWGMFVVFSGGHLLSLLVLCEVPQCEICHKVLGNDSMKPFQLKLHQRLAQRDRAFLKNKSDGLKKLWLDDSGSTQQTSKATTHASYVIAIAKIVLNDVAVNKLKQIPLSNNNNKSRIRDIAHNIKDQDVIGVCTNGAPAIGYFPDINTIQITMALTRNPFKCHGNDVPTKLQEEFCLLKHNSSAKDEFNFVSLSEFWVKMCPIYPGLGNNALRVLMQFSVTYLCESSFPSLLPIKSTTRNKHQVECDLRTCRNAVSPKQQVVDPFQGELWVALLVSVVAWGVTLWLIHRAWRWFAGGRGVKFTTAFLYGWGALLERPPSNPSVSDSGKPVTTAGGLQKVKEGSYSFFSAKYHITVIIDSKYTNSYGQTPFYISKRGIKVLAAFGWSFRHV
ncbi:SCAN domain-containing protein 3-like 8, partial [Homarus americanus]